MVHQFMHGAVPRGGNQENLFLTISGICCTTSPPTCEKSYHTLSGIVSNVLGCDPCNGDVYIFMNRSRNRIKLLHWEPGGGGH